MLGALEEASPRLHARGGLLAAEAPRGQNLAGVHRPQPQDFPGPNPSRHVEPPRSLDCMAARA